MTVLWLITGAALVMALLAWRRARQAAHRAEQLSQMYWELKYQHSELRVQVRRLTGEATVLAPTPEAADRPPDGFIPLTSLKR